MATTFTGVNDTQTPRRAHDAPSARTLDDLARLTSGELQDLYARGGVPDALTALDGDLIGRMLAVRGLDRGAPFHFLASLAHNRRFPWAGKSFKTGTGINRLNLGGAGRHRVFPFKTHIGTSVVDDRPTVILDYDLSDNPTIIRAIHDEIREVAPRLWLGPACIKRREGTPVALWFGLDANAR